MGCSHALVSHLPESASNEYFESKARVGFNSFIDAVKDDLIIRCPNPEMSMS